MLETLGLPPIPMWALWRAITELDSLRIGDAGSWRLPMAVGPPFGSGKPETQVIGTEQKRAIRPLTSYSARAFSRTPPR